MTLNNSVIEPLTKIWLFNKKKWLNDTALQLRHLSKIYDDMQCLCVLIWNIPWHTSGKHSKYCNHMSSILAVVYEIFSQLTSFEHISEKMRCVSCHTFSWKLHIDKRTLKPSLNLITSQRTCIFASIMRYCNSGICLYTFK